MSAATAGARVLAYLGGVRSGKSALAQARFSRETEALGLRSPAYLGTLEAGSGGRDPELALRLEAHRASRPGPWTLVEVGDDLPGTAARCLGAGHDAWLLDGLGAWAALRLEQPGRASADLDRFLDAARGAALLVLVLDEVGMGGVAAHPLARAFADLNGRLNQAACARADEVHCVQAGLALRLK